MPDTALDLGFGGGEFDGDYFTGIGSDFGEEFVDEALRHGVLRVESEDQHRQTVGERATKGREPDFFAQRDEARCAKIAERQRQIHREVIVEQSPAGEPGEFARDGDFADSGPTVEEDEFHDGGGARRFVARASRPWFG